MGEYDKQLYTVIGDMIRGERVKNGITLEQVANKVGVTPKTIQRYECGERKIKIDILMTITDFLGMDYNSFLMEARKRQIGGTETPVDSNYYLNDESKEVLDAIQVNPKLRILFDATSKLEPSDIDYVLALIERLKKEERQ